MSEPRPPRRPAILSAAQAEALVGDEDSAQSAALAHASAWALLGVEDEDFDAAAIARLRALVRTCGVDSVAHLWSRSPEFTLPGALWRLYLLFEWCERDMHVAQSRYEAGVSAQRAPGLEPPIEAPELQVIVDEVSALLRGDLTDDDLEHVLSHASVALRLLAAGSGTPGWGIRDPQDPLAHIVTTRAQAFLRTAEEVDTAARYAAVGTLD